MLRLVRNFGGRGRGDGEVLIRRGEKISVGGFIGNAGDVQNLLAELRIRPFLEARDGVQRGGIVIAAVRAGGQKPDLDQVALERLNFLLVEF